MKYPLDQKGMSKSVQQLKKKAQTQKGNFKNHGLPRGEKNENKNFQRAKALDYK